MTPEKTREGKVKPGFKNVGTHMIFDINMVGKFTWKSRHVSGGNKTAPSSSITYSIVVTSENVRLKFLIYCLNNLDIFACNIGNAYLNAPCREKLWTEEGSEFGVEKG